MRILIVKDAATKIPREVADRAEALAIQSQGFPVLEVDEQGNATPLTAEAQAAVVKVATVEADEPAKKPAKPPVKKPAKK